MLQFVEDLAEIGRFVPNLLMEELADRVLVLNEPFMNELFVARRFVLSADRKKDFVRRFDETSEARNDVFVRRQNLGVVSLAAEGVHLPDADRQLGNDLTKFGIERA